MVEIVISPFDPGTPSIDLTATEAFASAISLGVGDMSCSQHPAYVNSLAVRVSRGRRDIAPVDFCCQDFERKVMQAARSQRL